MSDTLHWKELDSSRPGGCIIDTIDLSEPVLEANGKILHDLWCQNSLIIVRGRDKLPESEEFELCQAFYNDDQLKKCLGTDQSQYISRSEYIELQQRLEQLELDHFSLTSEYKDAKMTISNLQDDIEMEKKKNMDKEEQLQETRELEEYSAGLREECGNLEDALQDLRARYSDLEQSYVKLNAMNDELRALRSRDTKEIEDKEVRIGKLERELLILEQASVAKSGFGVDIVLKQKSHSEGQLLPSRESPSTGMVKSPSGGEDSSDIVPIDGTYVAECDGALSQSSSVRQDPELTNGVSQGVDDPVEDISSPVDELSEETNATMNKRLQHLEENNRRLLSRLKFLDDRLATKEEAISRLNGRVEEVIIERDSFKEAMQGLLVGDTSMDSGADEESNDSDSDEGDGAVSQEAKQSQSSTNSPNRDFGGGASNAWQSAALKGVMGSFLTAGAGSSGVASPPTGANQTFQTLQNEVMKLRRENEKLSELKKLAPQVEELEKKLEEAVKATQVAEKWADEEFGVLSEKVDALTSERDDIQNTLDESREEVDRLQKQNARSASKYANYEEKLQTRNNRIEALELELKETNAKAIDPNEFEKLQNRVQELMGESKHWQQKAQSLSKEMQRSMSVQMELNRVQQELMETKSRIEELEAERTAFREAMQSAIAVSSDTPMRPQQTSPATAATAARQWLNNFM